MEIKPTQNPANRLRRAFNREASVKYDVQFADKRELQLVTYCLPILPGVIGVRFWAAETSQKIEYPHTMQFSAAQLDCMADCTAVMGARTDVGMNVESSQQASALAQIMYRALEAHVAE